MNDIFVKLLFVLINTILDSSPAHNMTDIFWPNSLPKNVSQQ